MYAVNNGVPMLDEQNDIELIAGLENGTHTYVLFSRRLITCDNKDLPITVNALF